MNKASPTMASSPELRGFSTAVSLCGDTRAHWHPSQSSFARVLSHAAREPTPPVDPLVLRVGRRELEAINLMTSRTRWSVPISPILDPAGGARTVVVPIGTRQLLALDRVTGDERWTTTLPEGAIAGVDVDGSKVVVTMHKRDAGGRMVVLTESEGCIDWMRSTPSAMSGPTCFGGLALVTQDGGVRAIDVEHGNEVAWCNLPALATGAFRVSVGRSKGPVKWPRALGVAPTASAEVEDGGGVELWAELEQLYRDGERLRWWVSLSPSTCNRHQAVLMARRAVFEVELGPRGRTHDARWGYFHDDETEFVAAHVGAATITVLLEDGGIVVLSRADGRELRRIWDDRYCLGAVFLDVERGQPISAPGCGPRCLASAQSLEWRSEQQCSGLGAGCRMTAAQITDDCEVG